jgi:hypothetical protein
MELAFLSYILMICGGLILLTSLVVFVKMTNWIVWLKGNVPVLVGCLGIWFAMIGWSLTSYLPVSGTHSVMTASVVKLSGQEFKLVIDDGVSTYELVGSGDHFQTRTELVQPNALWHLLGLPMMTVLDSMVIETNRFEQSVLQDQKDRWERELPFTGRFDLPGLERQDILSRQIPLRDGALYSLVLQHNRLQWVATNKAAKEAVLF